MTRYDDIHEALEAWGLCVLLDIHGLGWPPICTLGRIQEEGPTGAAIRPSPGPRTPRVGLPYGYWVVQRALKYLDPEGLNPCYRAIAGAEAGLLNGRIPPRAGMAERAAVLGLSRWTYRRHLKVLRQHLSWELDRRASRWRAVG